MLDLIRNPNKTVLSLNELNGELAKMEKKAYQPSEMVDEYIESFAYPGQTNLVFDEIKPDDETIKKHLEGDSSTGNSQEAGNAVKSDVGKRFYKNYKDNLYGAEQMSASYKRYPQPVDIAGEQKKSGDLRKTRGCQHDKAHEVMTNVESTKAKDVVIEDVDKMKQLISYREKTQ